MLKRKFGVKMRLASTVAAVTAGLMALGIQASGQLVNQRDVLDQDFDVFIDRLSGRWGNMDQFFFQSRLGIDADRALPLAHVVFAPVTGEADAAKAFYGRYEIVRGGAVRVIERLISAAPDYDTHAITVRAFTRQTDAQPLDLHLVGGASRSFNPDDWSEAPVCEIIWQRSGSQFTGRASGTDCAELKLLDAPIDPENGDRTLGEDDFWIPLSTAKGPRGVGYVDHLRLRRANLFDCRINIVVADAQKVEWGGLRVKEFDTWTDLRVHDQGGEAWVDTKDDPSRRLGFRLHNVRWPFGESENSRGIFLLDASKPDDGRGVAYASSSPDSDRIALSNRDASVTCYQLDDPFAP